MPKMTDRYSALVAWDDNGVTRREHMTGKLTACLLWISGHERVVIAEISHVIAETTERELRDALATRRAYVEDLELPPPLTMRVCGFHVDGTPFDIRVPRQLASAVRDSIVNDRTLKIGGMRYDVVAIDADGAVHVGRGY